MVSDDGPQHPTPLASGRTADVYALGTARVVMEHVTAHGFPAPTVHRTETHQIEMDRLEGPTLLQSLLDGYVPAGDAASMLATLHRDLHKVPTMPGADPDSAVLHLDLHPDNVILTASGPVVIDWTNAAHGPASDDVAMSALILAQVAVDETAMISQATRDLLRSFVACVGGIETEALPSHFWRVMHASVTSEACITLQKCVLYTRVSIATASRTPTLGSTHGAPSSG